MGTDIARISSTVLEIQPGVYEIIGWTSRIDDSGGTGIGSLQIEDGGFTPLVESNWSTTSVSGGNICFITKEFLAVTEINLAASTGTYGINGGSVLQIKKLPI